MILHDLKIGVVLGLWYGTARHEALWNGSRRVVLGPLRLVLPFLGAPRRFGSSLLLPVHHGLDEGQDLVSNQTTFILVPKTQRLKRPKKRRKKKEEDEKETTTIKPKSLKKYICLSVFASSIRIRVTASGLIRLGVAGYLPRWAINIKR